jgi:energy-converting hydrogenase Eha subunit E
MYTDRALGAGLTVFGIAGILLTMQINVRTFNDDPGPELFPIFGFTILVLCGLGMLIQAKPDPDDGVSAEERRQRFQRGAVMAGLFVLYSIGLWLVGFYIATPIMVYAFYHVIAGPGRRVPWQGVLYALAVTAGVHLIFGEFLHTLLPQGILF